MSDQFDRARDVMTPWERVVIDSTTGEMGTNRRGNAVDDNPYDAARSMIHTVLRKRQEREARTSRRELVAVLILGATLVAFAGMALLAPAWWASPAATAAVLTAGMLLGLNLRSRL